MYTREIPAHQWEPFLRDFSHRHQGEVVSIEVISPEQRKLQHEALGQPLVSISLDHDDAAQRPRVDVTVGGAPSRQTLHSIRRPVHIRLAKTDIGPDHVLEIEEQDGSTTCLRLGDVG